MIYLTGDTHGKFDRIGAFCDKMQTSRDDILIILGDAGINFHASALDILRKEHLAKLPITLTSVPSRAYMVMRWTPATRQKEVQNMTHKELEQLVLGKKLPCGGTNDEGETVIIEAGSNEGVRFFHLTTAQNNNWVRHNYIYEDGSREELFEK